MKIARQDVVAVLFGEDELRYFDMARHGVSQAFSSQLFLEFHERGGESYR